MNANKVLPSLKTPPPNHPKKLTTPPSPQKNPLEKPTPQIPSSNTYRILQQIRHLKTIKHRHHITKISQNRIQIQVEFELEKQIIKNGLGSSCIFFQEVCQDRIGFVIVLHEMFPWCAPFLVCNTQIMFPRLDDYRDYLQDVLQGEWWPNITAADIIQLLPNFITNKIQPKPLQSPIPTTNTSFDYGKRPYSQSLPHSLDCILRNCKGLKLCYGQYFNNQDVLMGKYQHIIVGMSWSDFVLFKPYQKAEDRYYVMRRWHVRQIKKISSKKIKGSWIKSNSKVNPGHKERGEAVIEKYQFCLVLVNGRKQYIKIKFGSNQQVQNIGNRSSFKQMKEFEFDNQKSEDLKIRKKTSQKPCLQQRQQSMPKSIFLEQQNSRADLEPPQSQSPNHLPHHLPQTNPPTTLTFLRHITQYIQLRQWVLTGDDVGFQSKIRMISQIIQNSAQLEQQIQLQLYYQCKLKEVIRSQYMVGESREGEREVDQITSKFQFDI